MGLADALKLAGLAHFDGKCGDIYLVQDADVMIPERKAKDRHLHPHGRTCVILSNNVFCQDPFYPIVSIAPTSHRIDIKDASDFPIQPSDANGLRCESIVLLGHIQPVRKGSLFHRVGTLTPVEWEEMALHLIWAFDRIVQNGPAHPAEIPRPEMR